MLKLISRTDPAPPRQVRGWDPINPPRPGKHLVVLGGDPKPKQTGRLENFIRNKKPRPLFNHYANGSGWWDCNMEGVDGDEVGCNQAWEGVGSTTLGGLEWH
ncbi:hypothetical protein CK203_103080 [Vitis vinifera]|uniref:Uncharacterized protein n=1 Tax=Vitis vinifera TaxID=29760 RepID=A0A438CVS4_VITVI|nr:hypothetical protein CK203_103080 [Vitis vinifera]